MIKQQFAQIWQRRARQKVQGGLWLLLCMLWLHTSQAVIAAPSLQPVVEVRINGLRYDSQKNLYTLSLSISEPSFVERLVLKVEEKEAGKQVKEEFFSIGSRSVLITDLDGAPFVDERDYVIKIEGIDYAGHLILRQDEHNSLDPAERSILATKEFKHTLPKAQPITASILNVNVDFANRRLLIDLDIRDEDAIQINKVEGWVLDKESGARIHEFGPNLFAQKRIQEVLPPTISAATTPREYELYLVLTTKTDQTIRPEPRQFKPIPPPAPSFFSRLTTALNHSPTILVTVLIIVLLVVGWLVIQKGSGVRAPLLPPRPPISVTTVTENYGGSRSRQPSLRISVVQTGQAADQIEKTVQQFPCYIGREGCHVNIPHDTQISRRHAQLTLLDGHFYLADLGSTNGTFVDNTKLLAKQTVAVNELSTIRLGKRTLIKIAQTD